MSTVALAALVAAGSLAVVVAPAPAEAAVVEAFTVTYDDTIWGDYLLVGNSQLECITSGTTDRFDADNDGNTAEALGLVVDWTHYTDCQNDANRNSVGGDSPNDDRFMVFSRTDTGTAGIFNSSDVTITLPPGSSVDAAYLYWHGNDVQASGLGGGTATALNTADTIDSSPGAAPWPSCQATSTSTDWSSYGSSGGTASTTTITKRLRATFDAAAAGARSQMRIRVGAASSYQTITSSDEDLSPTDGHSGHLYQQEADVTSLLDSAPRGVPVTITGANISTGEGFGCTGAWALAIVYKYAARHATYAPDLRRVQLYDGFTEVSNTDTIATTLGGFLASGGGTVEPRAGFVAYEGDQQITGDAFQLEALTLEEPRLTPSGTTTNY